MEQEELLNRIANLEREIQSLKQSSTIPREIEQAFRNRGFIKNEDIIAGSGRIDASGGFQVPMPNVSTNALVFVAPGVVPTVGTPFGFISSVGTTNPGINDLFVLASVNDAGAIVNYIVFPTLDSKKNIA